MFQNRNPYYKFTLPKLKPNPLEAEIWDNLRVASDAALQSDSSAGIDPVIVESAYMSLSKLREQANVKLSMRTQKFLELENDDLLSFALVMAQEKLEIEVCNFILLKY